MAARYAIAVVVGAVITVALFYVMQAVIRSDKNPLNEALGGRMIDFVRLLDDEAVDVKRQKPKPPPPPDEQPPDIPEPEFDSSDTSIGTSWSGPAPSIDVEIGSGGYASDGDYLPLVKVEPIYPRRALSRGIEGYVIVSLTVTTSGATKDVFIVESDPPGVFDRSAVSAALKFKYKPKMVDGRAVEVTGVKNLIKFQMEDEH